MSISVLMPKLGLTMTEGVVDEWNKKEGDTVRKGEFICSISSEKLSQDIEAEADGVLLKIVVPAGETALCTTPIAYIGRPGEQIAEASGTQAAGATPVTVASVAQSNPVAEVASAVAATGTPPHTGPDGQRVFISKLAKRIALDRGLVDYSQIPGTGGHGRITRRDVERFLAAAPAPTTAPAASAPVQTVAGGGLAGKRRVIAKNMMQSLHTTAQLTLHRKVDVTQLMQFRQDMKDRLADSVESSVFSLNVLLLKAVALALRETPEMNSRYDGQTLTQLDQVNIGVAVALEDGLVVPIVSDVAQKPLSEISRDFRVKVENARSGTLDTTLAAGFTITNLGAEGIEYFTPVLNTPEVGILGVGALDERLRLNGEGAVVVTKELPLSLTFDHQVVDGSPAARFLATIAGYLGTPYRLLV